MRRNRTARAWRAGDSKGMKPTAPRPCPNQGAILRTGTKRSVRAASSISAQAGTSHASTKGGSCTKCTALRQRTDRIVCLYVDMYTRRHDPSAVKSAHMVTQVEIVHAMGDQQHRRPGRQRPDARQPVAMDTNFLEYAYGTNQMAAPHANMMPYMAISYIICLNGYYPQRP